MGEGGIKNGKKKFWRLLWTDPKVDVGLLHWEISRVEVYGLVMDLNKDGNHEKNAKDNLQNFLYN